MARLFLLRHAKSSWDEAGLADYDRPLNIRGKSSAPIMGRHMADHALMPDRILCSGSRRTRETFAGILPFIKGDFDAKFLRSIYSGMAMTYAPILKTHGGTAKTLMLIGHNPTIQETALSLIGRGNPDLIEQIREKFPTAGLAVIDFDELDDWARLAEGTGRIVAFFRPREIEVVGAPQTADADD